MSGDLDFNKYSQGGVVLPEGTYRVKIDKWEKCVAKTGMEQIRVYATVVDGPEQGQTITDHLAMSQSAGWRIMWFINEIMAWEKEDRELVGKLSIGSEKFNRCFELAKGRTMFWTLVTDPTYGNNKVKEYIVDPTNSPIKPDDLEDIPDFIKQKQNQPQG